MLTKTKTYDGEEFYKAKEVDKQFELLKDDFQKAINHINKLIINNPEDKIFLTKFKELFEMQFITIEKAH